MNFIVRGCQFPDQIDDNPMIEAINQTIKVKYSTSHDKIFVIKQSRDSIFVNVVLPYFLYDTNQRVLSREETEEAFHRLLTLLQTIFLDITPADLELTTLHIPCNFMGDSLRYLLLESLYSSGQIGDLPIQARFSDGIVFGKRKNYRVSIHDKKTAEKEKRHRIPTEWESKDVIRMEIRLRNLRFITKTLSNRTSYNDFVNLDTLLHYSGRIQEIIQSTVEDIIQAVRGHNIKMAIEHDIRCRSSKFSEFREQIMFLYFYSRFGTNIAAVDKFVKSFSNAKDPSGTKSDQAKKYSEFLSKYENAGESPDNSEAVNSQNIGEYLVSKITPDRLSLGDSSDLVQRKIERTEKSSKLFTTNLSRVSPGIKKL